MFGDLALTGDREELAEIATHLSDVLHIWGTIDRANGARNFSLVGWEKLDMVQYEMLEGKIVNEGENWLLQTTNNELLILAAAPTDIPEGLEVYVSAIGRRNIGAAYPVLVASQLCQQDDLI